MKDYYAIDVSDFLNNNLPFYIQVKAEALELARSGKVDVVAYIEQRLREEHDKRVSQMGISDPFEYYVNRHEKDSAVARKVIEEHRQQHS